MKKLTAIVLVFAVLISFASCSLKSKITGKWENEVADLYLGADGEFIVYGPDENAYGTYTLKDKTLTFDYDDRESDFIFKIKSVDSDTMVLETEDGEPVVFTK